MKRSIDETDAPNANDARQKLKDSLIPFDQSREASEALLLQCCYSILERQPSRALNVRGLVHELNRTVAPGAFTKRGEAHGEHVCQASIGGLPRLVRGPARGRF